MKLTMRKFLGAVVLILWGQFAGAKDFIDLNPPRPTSDPTKVEVIEFFWYGCPHCYRFDPYLTDWLKKKPNDVVFRRQPVIFGPNWAPQARAYYTAEVLGIVDKVHQDFFDAMHKDRKRMSHEEELADFFADHGVDADSFNNTYHSFAVDMKVRQAEAAAAEYGITGVPSIVVNGKYLITGGTAKTFENMIQVMQDLVEKDRRYLAAVQ